MESRNSKSQSGMTEIFSTRTELVLGTQETALLLIQLLLLLLSTIKSCSFRKHLLAPGGLGVSANFSFKANAAKGEDC